MQNRALFSELKVELNYGWMRYVPTSNRRPDHPMATPSQSAVSAPDHPNPTRRRLNIALGLGSPLLFAALGARAQTSGSTALPPPPRFTQQVEADSPLAGRILGAGEQSLTPEQLLGACAQSSLCMLGEQHDHPDHHALQAWIIGALAQDGRLAAVALEMAETSVRFDGPRDATETEVRTALHWNDAGWPWRLYRAPVMAAVHAGIPVAGVNLPRADMRAAMRDPRWDASVPPDVRLRILDDVERSHCGLLPAAQLPAMTRVQLARDDSMAAHTLALTHPGKTVVLLTGSFHADRTLGIALHLAAHAAQPVAVFSLLLQGLDAGTPAELPAGYDAVWFTPGIPPVDHCAELRQTMKRQ
jgi:uncharacterized iron-regulated protein